MTKTKAPKVLHMRRNAQGGTQRPFLVSRLPGKADGSDTTLARVVERGEQNRRIARNLNGGRNIAFMPDRN